MLGECDEFKGRLGGLPIPKFHYRLLGLPMGLIKVGVF